MERGHRWPRMGSHPVVLNNCVGPQCALDWPQRQEPIRVAWWCQERRLQAGQKHCWDGWEVGAKLPHSSQPSWGRALLAAGWGADFSLPCQAEFSWLFQRKALILQAEGWSTGCWRGSASCASPALNPGQYCISWAAERPFACQLLTVFSTEVSTQLFRLLLYAFCIAWQAQLLYCVESHFFQFT